MVRTLIFSLLLAAFLAQGWAQAGMIMPADASSPADCAGHLQPDADSDCCPDGAMASGACASLCSAAFALTASLPVVPVIRGVSDTAFIQPARAGPRYLPLNPPPIA
jgi:hypothetical protein